MEHIQEACLALVLASSVLSGPSYGQFTFSWDLINRHGLKFQSAYNFSDAQVLLQLSLMVTSANLRNQSLKFPEWITAHELKYELCPLVKLPIVSELPVGIGSQTKTLGYVLYNSASNTVVIIFVGTSNMCMAGLDLNYKQVELTELTNYIPGIKGHSGFYLGYQSVVNQILEILKLYIDKQPTLVITGHSLGGALSQLCALDLAYYQPIHYSLAAPLVFNQFGSRIFNQVVPNSYRISNTVDIVTMVPLPVMPNKDSFCHVGKMIAFQDNFGDYSLNHTLAYANEYKLNILIRT